ncbi:MAG: thioether cross-link-forming SCIFF peptide maturase [Firmicutes bacterium]|nr:thioether cross-link-forming SCIFF peptide maturase [Bacillota bacterium]
MIHQYKLNGYNIVIDVYSGCVHVVDDLAYDVIALYKSNTCEEIVGALLPEYEGRGVSEKDIERCAADVTELVRNEELFTDDIFAGMAGKLKEGAPVVKALCLHVAHTCNLNCTYCFASQGKYHGERALMSFEVGRRALDFLIESSGTRTNLEVDFFGGEPLMNFDVVKRLVAYGREREANTGKRFRFTLTTNGVLIDDEVIDFCNREMHNVVLSLDGRREIHDSMRKNYAGVGSYDIIVPKFKRLVERRGDKSYYMRGTFTHKNTDFTNDIFHVADLGFTELSMEPVVCSPDDPYALTEDDIEKVGEQYEILAHEMIKRRREGHPFTFYHYMIDLEHGPCIYKRLSGCGSGTEYLAVTPTGELYPCHQFVGEPEYLMGDVWHGVTNTALRDKFKKCNVYSRPECEGCWAKLYCSGGCAANAYHASGDITGIYEYGCRLFKKRIECAIMMKCAEAEDGEEHEPVICEDCGECGVNA